MEKISFDDVEVFDKPHFEHPKAQEIQELFDFKKFDLRVGKILKIEEHPNADKLFVLTVDLGEKEERIIVAGLRGHYKKEELRGKKAVFVINLEPVVIRGVKSSGMILAAISENKSRIKILITDGDIEEGAKIS